MSVLITRPRADSERIAELLHRDGIAAFIWPLTEIRFIDGAVPPEPAALAITSSNAVAGYSRLTRDRTATVYCVGNRTAETARMAGFEDVQSADGDFAALVGLIVKDRPTGLHHPRGEDVTADLPAALLHHGIQCTEQIVYAARPSGPPEASVIDALTDGRIEVFTVWSRRNATLLAESLVARPEWKTGHATLIAISDNAAAPLGKLGFRRIIVVSRPNATQMIAEIRAALR